MAVEPRPGDAPVARAAAAVAAGLLLLRGGWPADGGAGRGAAGVPHRREVRPPKAARPPA